MNRNPIDELITVYMQPDADVSQYPDRLEDDMSMFRNFRYEVQWVFYLMLRDYGFRVELSSDYPKEGIFVIHKGNTDKFVWNPNLLVVSGQWDYARDDRAQIHMVSNEYKTTRESVGLFDRLTMVGHPCFLPPITHSVIIPRNPELKDRFEKIAFIGDEKNLDEAFRTGAFAKQLKELGMEFVIINDPRVMNDFSDIDAVIAVRQIGQVISNKPFTKLSNAWRGGVPALLGCEVGYREVRESEYDYIEADSVQEVVDGLFRLKNDLEFRQKMLDQGSRRAVAYTAEEQTRIWGEFFEQTVVEAYREWRGRSVVYRNLFLILRYIRHLLRENISLIGRKLFLHRSKDYS